VPLHEHRAADVLVGVDVHPAEISTRVPTLDDVYLQLKGAELADAA